MMASWTILDSTSAVIVLPPEQTTASRSVGPSSLSSLCFSVLFRNHFLLGLLSQVSGLYFSHSLKIHAASWQSAAMEISLIGGGGELGQWSMLVCFVSTIMLNLSSSSSFLSLKMWKKMFLWCCATITHVKVNFTALWKVIEGLPQSGEWMKNNYNYNYIYIKQKDKCSLQWPFVIVLKLNIICTSLSKNWMLLCEKKYT